MIATKFLALYSKKNAYSFQIFASRIPECVIKVDFIVGSDSNPLRNTREGLYDRKKQKQILQRYDSSTNLSFFKPI